MRVYCARPSHSKPPRARPANNTTPPSTTQPTHAPCVVGDVCNRPARTRTRSLRENGQQTFLENWVIRSLAPRCAAPRSTLQRPKRRTFVQQNMQFITPNLSHARACVRSCVHITNMCVRTLSLSAALDAACVYLYLVISLYCRRMFSFSLWSGDTSGRACYIYTFLGRAGRMDCKNKRARKKTPANQSVFILYTRVARH